MSFKADLWINIFEEGEPSSMARRLPGRPRSQRDGNAAEIAGFGGRRSNENGRQRGTCLRAFRASAARDVWRSREASVSAVPIRFTAHEEADVDVVTAEIDREESTITHYEEAKLSVRRQLDPHETPVSEMMKHVVRVVSVEGPIHESEIVVRIRSAWDWCERAPASEKRSRPRSGPRNAKAILPEAHSISSRTRPSW